MATIYIIKVDSSNNPIYKYRLGNLSSFTYDINSPLSANPLPEFDSADLVLIKLEGNSSSLKVGWKLREEPSNQVVYPTSPAIESSLPFQMIRFFKNIFRPKSITDRYELMIECTSAEDGFDDTLEWFGGIANIHFDTSGDAPTSFNASFDFMEGNISALFEQDVATQPLSLNLSVPASGQLKVDWLAPSNTGLSAITGYTVEYALGGNNFTSTSVSAATFTKTITGLTPGIYYARVYATNTQGAGRRSITGIITVT